MSGAGFGIPDGSGGYVTKLEGDGDAKLGDSAGDVLQITGSVEQLGTSLKISGDDARIKINGDTDSHPGIEFHENGSRHWIVYNDYTTDNLTFKSSADRVVITDSGRLGVGTTSPAYKFVVAGNMAINEHIRHNGDVDTRLSFPDNGKINLVADGKSVFKFDGSDIVLNNANANYDTKVMADNGQVVLHVDAGNNRVGIGTTSPSVELDVDGTTKSTHYITGVTTQDLGNATSNTLSTNSGVILLDADSINGTMMMGQEVHSLVIPNGTNSGQRLSLIVKTTTNNVSIVPAGIISGSFGSLNDSMGTTTLEFIWISEGSHNAWHQV